MQVYYNYTEYIQEQNLWASLCGRKQILIKDPWNFLNSPEKWELSCCVLGLLVSSQAFPAPCTLFFALPPCQPLALPTLISPGPPDWLPFLWSCEPVQSNPPRSQAHWVALGKVGIPKTSPLTMEELGWTIDFMTKSSSFSERKK